MITGHRDHYQDYADLLRCHDALIAEKAAFLEAAQAAIRTAEEAQGGWAGVLLPYAPEWTEPYKDIIETLEAAIAPFEERTP